jgi:DNA repair/transcription protein MET18/MMS19
VGNAACAMIQNAISVDNKGSRVARVSMLWFLQLLVNKFGAAKESSVVPMMQELVDNVASKSDEEVNNTYQTLAYFATAALACFDPSQTVLVKLMLSGISEPNHGLKVAKSFRLLLAPSEILNKENFCIIRPLRKQRLYDLVVPQIMSKWVTNQDKKSKDNCLIALAGVLDYMEPALLNDNAREILPLCTEGTNVQNDEWAKFVFISTLLTLVQICSSMVEEHLDSVINRMTDRTHNTLDSPSDSSVRCRAMALEVLGSLTMHIRPALLLRRKFKLMAELDVALDDCSREVRQKAERCKMLWFNLADSELEE